MQTSCSRIKIGQDISSPINHEKSHSDYDQFVVAFLYLFLLAHENKQIEVDNLTLLMNDDDLRYWCTAQAKFEMVLVNLSYLNKFV